MAAVVAALLGALLLFSSWDSLYTSLELPRAAPALDAQIGSLAVLGLAYLLWSGASNPALVRPVSIAGVLFYLGSALVIAFWLLFKSREDLQIDDTGVVILIVAAVLFAAIGAALASTVRRA